MCAGLFSLFFVASGSEFSFFFCLAADFCSVPGVCDFLVLLEIALDLSCWVLESKDRTSPKDLYSQFVFLLSIETHSRWFLLCIDLLVVPSGVRTYFFFPRSRFRAVSALSSVSFWFFQLRRLDLPVRRVSSCRLTSSRRSALLGPNFSAQLRSPVERDGGLWFHFSGWLLAHHWKSCRLILVSCSSLLCSSSGACFVGLRELLSTCVGFWTIVLRSHPGWRLIPARDCCR
jgi:hypothetical protein